MPSGGSGGDRAGRGRATAVLSDYALAVQTALNLDGQQPFKYASLAVDEALRDVEVSLEELEKRGVPEAGAVRGSLHG